MALHIFEKFHDCPIKYIIILDHYYFNKYVKLLSHCVELNLISKFYVSSHAVSYHIIYYFHINS